MRGPFLISKGRFSERGLSLTEVLITVFIITPVLIFLLKVFLQNVRGVTESWDEIKAISSAQGLMDQIRTMKWDEITVVGSTVATTDATLPLGPEGSETPFVDFDDVDDWNNFDPNSATAEYRRFVKVDYVDVDATGNVTAATGRSDFKRVLVSDHEPRGKARCHFRHLHKLFPLGRPANETRLFIPSAPPWRHGHVGHGLFALGSSAHHHRVRSLGDPPPQRDHPGPGSHQRILRRNNQRQHRTV